MRCQVSWSPRFKLSQPEILHIPTSPSFHRGFAITLNNSIVASSTTVKRFGIMLTKTLPPHNSCKLVQPIHNWWIHALLAKVLAQLLVPDHSHSSPNLLQLLPGWAPDVPRYISPPYPELCRTRCFQPPQMLASPPVRSSSIGCQLKQVSSSRPGDWVGFQGNNITGPTRCHHILHPFKDTMFLYNRLSEISS